VPDILIAGTSVGLNYDGQEHLNLDGLAKLAAATVDGLVDEGDLALAKRAIRDKIHDDLLRNRELAASGLLVLPVTSEDLFRPGATDALMSVVCDLVEQRDGRDMTLTRKAIDSQALRRRRQLRVWSILPWSSAEDYSRELLRQERESASGGHAGDVVTLGADYFDLL
jgi:hypothetical protein